MSDVQELQENPSAGTEEPSQVEGGSGMESGTQETSNVGETSGSAGRSSRRRSRSRSPRKELTLETVKIGFLGSGKMAQSIADGLLSHGNVKSDQLFVAAPSSKNFEYFKAKGVKTSKRLIEIFGRHDCDVVIFCMHGSVIKKAVRDGGKRPAPITTNYIPNMRHPIYFLSCMSGVSIDELKSVLLNPEHPGRYKLQAHRIMANTAVSHGLGIIGIDCDPDSKRLAPLLRTLLSSIGKLEHVPEDQMDAACATGGAGLAFAFYFIAAMAEGGTKVGLGRPLAQKFAAMTLKSAADAVLESGKHPSQLKDEVAGAGGPAVYGIHTLDKAECASGIAAAVEAAFKRSQELAQ